MVMQNKALIANGIIWDSVPKSKKEHLDRKHIWTMMPKCAKGRGWLCLMDQTAPELQSCITSDPTSHDNVHEGAWTSSDGHSIWVGWYGNVLKICIPNSKSFQMILRARVGWLLQGWTVWGVQGVTWPCEPSLLTFLPRAMHSIHRPSKGLLLSLEVLSALFLGFGKNRK